LLQNHHPKTIEGQRFQLLIFFQNSLILIKELSFINLYLNSSRTLAKPYKYPLEKKTNGEKKHKETHCEKILV
jgi:hypothetical protein